MIEVFRKLKNKPKLIETDANGDILIKNKDGDVIQTLPVGPYRTPTKEEIAKMEDVRWEKIAAEEEKYEVALEKLRDASDAYKRGEISLGTFMRANLGMERANRERNNAQYALRTITSDETHEIRHILFEERYETRKMPHDVYFAKMRHHTLQNQYVRYGVEAEEEAEEEEEEASVPEVTSIPVPEEGAILFGGADENEYGYLAPDFPVEFTLNGVKYFTVDQVLAAEKARTYREDDIRLKILKTRSAKMMRVYAEMLDKKAPTDGLEGQAVAEAALAAMAGPRPEANEWATARRGVLEAATFAKFKQNPALEDRLLQTGNSTFIYADAKNKIDGIGLGIGDPRETDSTKWKGDNQLGAILERVRSRLRGETDAEKMDAAAGTEEVREETISQAAYEEKVKQGTRLGAILAARRTAAAR